MRSRLEEQRIGDDGDDRGKGQRAGARVLWAVQQDTHHEAALGLSLHRNRLRAASAATRHLFVIGNSSRHFSSPGKFGPLVRIAPWD